MDGEEEAAEAVARIRLVRCPRCDKFLPELPAYSVYVCGGCGATLQAAKKNSAQSSHDTDSGNVKYLEVLDCFPEASAAKPGGSTADRSDTSKMADVHSKPVYGHHDSIQTGPSPSNLNMSVRDNGKEAKYRHIRDWENREMGQSSRIRDTSPRSPINGIPPHAYQRYRYSTREHLGERSLDGPSRVRGLEKDRAEILRMLDELRGQVQQSHDVTDRPRGSALTNKAADAPSSFANPDRLNKLRHDAPQLHRNGSHHSPSLNARSPSVPRVYAPLPAQQDRGGYAESISHARASSYPASLYPWRNFDNYFFGQHNPDPLLSCRHDGFYHQAACSCLHCCHQEFLPVQGNHLGFNDHRSLYPLNTHGAYPVDSPLFGQQRYSTRGNNTTLQRNHPRANVSKKPAQTCESVAGGAPFTICYNCYEVLQIPKKQSLSGKEYKLRCGSCSHAILVKLDGNRLNVSEFAVSTHLSDAQENNMGTNQQTPDERSVPAYRFSDGSPSSQEKDLHSNFSESENNHSPLGTNSEGTTQSRDLPLEDNVVSHVPSLPHHNHCGSSPSEHSGVRSRSTHSEPEKVILLTESCKQNSVKNVCISNEMQYSDNDFDGPEYIDDRLNAQHGPGHGRATKASDSFLTNLIKRSFKINNGTRNGRARVYVNGFPISDRAVRKAEKLAGAICPGDYWYDYHAGFWGVMGRPCLGMIPPYIPEFNYPMPKNCGGGNTSVFVNGRELHQKDLDLLVTRGLSDSPGRSYVVENSGKVSDELSGEELYCLGKLAPT
ncbi:hypothetical protein HU200_052523 [Digitaria exilis]|uniref:Zinc-ribbon domain-containing protein n=1 Tax=Digitaria exilis TaxID=1010633 RepID=A0A835E9C9_9POAL|nr:hypothetical protein HU200_052523 [Digitaria exilis]